MKWFGFTLSADGRDFDIREWADDEQEALGYALSELEGTHAIPRERARVLKAVRLAQCPDCRARLSLPGHLCNDCTERHAEQVAHYLESEAEDTRYLGLSGGDIVLWRHEGVKMIGLEPRTLCRHSPTGLEWGYAGSGPADLALNALYQITGDLVTAFRHYQAFKSRFVASVHEEGGMIRRAEVEAWLQGRAAGEGEEQIL
jgi:hypothetical protein